MQSIVGKIASYSQFSSLGAYVSTSLDKVTKDKVCQCGGEVKAVLDIKTGLNVIECQSCKKRYQIDINVSLVTAPRD